MPSTRAPIGHQHRDGDTQRTSVLRRAAVRATLAPSVHNTQPWTLRLRGAELELHADRSRQLGTLDPSGRQLAISCGAALMNARVSLTSAGMDVRVDRFPDRNDQDFLARITAVGFPHPAAGSRRSSGAPADLGTLDRVVEGRHTNRQPFTSGVIPVDVLATLATVVDAEHCELVVVTTPECRLAVGALRERAQARLDSDPAARAEARAWTPTDTAPSGDAPPAAVPDHQSLVVLGSAEDGPVDWLHSGEALERMLLEVTGHGFVAGPWSQCIVTAGDRTDLRAVLGIRMTPQVVLGLGRAPASVSSRRRRLVEVLIEGV